MKKEIDVFDYTQEIMKALKKGVLLTTKTDAKVNSMTISWGMFGIEWSKPIFMTLIRENRFTRQQLDKNPEFTVNIPYGEYDSKILGFCGAVSGHNINKIDELGLTTVEAEEISVPAIKELPLTLECRVVYKQMQDQKAMPQDFQDTFYPQNVDSSFHGPNKDNHVAYYGEIVKAYLIE